VIIEVPLALSKDAPIIGCKSVATPGNGSVEISIGFKF